MATVIDELVLKLGIDIVELQKGQTQLAQSVKDLQDKLRRHGEEIDHSSKNILASLDKVRKGYVEIYAAAAYAFAKIAQFADGVARSNMVLGQHAAAVGMNVEYYDLLRRAADSFNGSGQDLENTLKAVNTEFQAFNTQGEIGDTVRFMMAKGVHFKDAAGNLTSLTDRLREYARIANQAPVDQREYLASRVHMSFAELQFLALSNEALEKQLDLQRKIRVTTEEQVQGSAKFWSGVNRIEDAFGHLYDVVIGKIGPGMGKFFDGLAVKISQFGDLVGHGIDELAAREEGLYKQASKQLAEGNWIGFLVSVFRMNPIVGEVEFLYGKLKELFEYLTKPHPESGWLSTVSNVLGKIKSFTEWLGGGIGTGGAAPGGGGAGAGGGGGGGVPTTPGPVGTLKEQRQQFAAELAGDPELNKRLWDLAEAEVGGQGPAAKQAFIEETMNRAAARHQTLRRTIQDPNYFPPETMRKIGKGGGKPDESMLKDVIGGSNISGFATGNASGGVGFNKGQETFNPGTGERFGIEGPDKAWADQTRLMNAGVDGATGLPRDVLRGAYWTLSSSRGNPEALRQYLESVGVHRDGNWCGEFAAATFRHAGLTPPKDYQIASNWRNIGPEVPAGKEQPGDVAVRRGVATGATGSHVGFVSGVEGKGIFDLLGGNQGRPVSPNQESRYQFFRPMLKDVPPAATGAAAAYDRLGGNVNTNTNSNNSTSNSVNINNMTVNTPDAVGFMGDIGSMVDNHSTATNMNTGPN